MRCLRAVLFDFFGTLTCAVTRGPAHAALARRLGCDPADFARALDSTFFARARGSLGTPQEALRVVTAMVGAYPSAAAIRAATFERVEAVGADTRLRPEAEPVLRELRALGLRIGLISDCGPELVDLLPTLPIAPLIDAAVFSVQVGACKPEPAIYRAACARLGVEPAACLYVGDGGSQELSGARSVGIRALRLAAPDLDGHLVFNREVSWPGLAVRSLPGVLTLVRRAQARALVAV